jgi:hypothetical protein
MAFQPVPGVYAAHVRMTVLGEDTENIFYYGYSGSPNAGDAQTIADEIGANWFIYWQPILPQGVSGREVYVRDLSVEFAVQGVDTSIAAVDGDVVSPVMPSFNTLAIARRSSLTGRSTRGRIFWQGLAESQVDGQTVLTTHADAIVTALIQQDAAIATIGFPPLIVSRKSGGVVLPEGVTYPLLTWAYNDRAVDTRRSRKSGS